ncbi:MAG: UvrD-helicase domain-containing protein [Flavobacteriales bacterium]
MENLKNFIVYKSSAGSGKTYTLVREFLRIVIESDDSTRYRNILAITFTNKAAAEMKERVLDNLKKLSEEKDSDLLLDYAKEFGIEKGIIKTKAHKILQSVLHNYSDLKILTIDKFTHRIIRAFAKDLNLSADFEIEMDSDGILKESIDLLISKAGKDEELSVVLLDYLNSKIDDEKNWKIEDDLFNFAKELLKEDNDYFLESLKQMENEALKKSKSFVLSRKKELETEVSKAAKYLLDLLKKNGIDSTDFAGQTIFNFYKKISEGEFDSLTKPFSKRLQDALDEDKWLVGKASATAKANIGLIQEELKNMHNEITDVAGEFFLFRLLSENSYNVFLIKEIAESISSIKEEGNILMISDFNKLISTEIKNQIAPYIYEKIGERYKNIMIDEFQDTSVMQWHNLIPLIDNSLSVGQKTLLVGDAKQAIYRFRGGKVEQFVSLPHIIDKKDDELLEERELAMVNNHRPEKLETNYRSHEQVIQFNNWFFEGLKKFLPENNQKIYDFHSQLTNKKNEGLVEVSFLDGEKEELDELNLEEIKLKIEECKADGFQLKDISILVGKNKAGTKVSNYLIENGYEVLTSESLLIAEDPEVKLISNFLRYIQNNQDNKAKVEVIKYFFENEKYSPALLKHTTKIKKKTTILLNELLVAINPNFNIEKLYEMSLYDMAETLSREFIPPNQKPNAFLIEFLNIIHSYSSRVNDLKSFNDYFLSKSEKLSLDTPDADAITIMTVHKSKGLQFPVVISAFTNWDFYVGTNRANVWVDFEGKYPDLPFGIIKLKKEVEATAYKHLYSEDYENIKLDKFNMLYVTLTRAEQRLYVICDRKVQKGKGEFIDNKINSFVFQVCHTHENFKDDKLVVGKRKKKEKTEETVEKIEELTSMTSTNWRAKINISKQYQDLWGEKSKGGKIAYGNLIHNIMAQVNSEKDIEQSVSDFTEKGMISLNEQEFYKNEIAEILKIPGVENWFLPDNLVANEKEIISKDGSLYRPDKIIMLKDKTIVLDFKTGEKRKSYAKQLDNYGQLLSDMNYPNIEKYLLFTKERELVKI